MSDINKPIKVDDELHGVLNRVKYTEHHKTINDVIWSRFKEYKEKVDVKLDDIIVSTPANKIAVEAQ